MQEKGRNDPEGTSKPLTADEATARKKSCLDGEGEGHLSNSKYLRRSTIPPGDVRVGKKR